MIRRFSHPTKYEWRWPMDSCPLSVTESTVSWRRESLRYSQISNAEKVESSAFQINIDTHLFHYSS